VVPQNRPVWVKVQSQTHSLDDASVGVASVQLLELAEALQALVSFTDGTTKLFRMYDVLVEQRRVQRCVIGCLTNQCVACADPI
jgi:hypothetical protein